MRELGLNAAPKPQNPAVMAVIKNEIKMQFTGEVIIVRVLIYLLQISLMFLRVMLFLHKMHPCFFSTDQLRMHL